MELNNYKGFAILESDHSAEAEIIRDYADTTGTSLRIISHEDERVPEQYIPVGKIDWIQKMLGKNLTPDYYPCWCQDTFYRHIWKSDIVPVNGLVFVKSASKYESLIGSTAAKGSATILDKWSDKNRAECWCSDKVEFTDAYRYYITKGKVVAVGQMSGNSAKARILDVKIPTSWSGALDFGHIKTGEFALIEAHYPISCGYIDGGVEAYLQWIIDGWVYIKNI